MAELNGGGRFNGLGGTAVRLATSVKFWLSVFAAVVAVYAGAPAVGLELPRWAWRHELDRAALQLGAEILKVAERTKQNEIQLLENSLRNLKSERREIAREKAEAVQKGQQPHPRVIDDERENLETIQNVQSKLRTIRGF